MASSLIPAGDSAGEAIRHTIWHARMIGYTWVKISELVMEKHDTLMNTNDLVHQYNLHLQAMRNTLTEETRDTFMLMELSRLDALQSSQWQEAMDGDIQSGRYVLDVIKTRMKLLNLDIPNPADTAIQQTVMVVGNDTSEWIAALTHGRDHGAIMPGVARDDSGDDKEDA